MNNQDAEAKFSQQLVNRAMRFEPSTDGTFVSRGRGYMARFAPDGVTLALPSSTTQEPAGGKSAEPQPIDYSFVKMTFEHANASPRIEGIDKVAGKTNYMLGDNPASWRANVESYAKLRYVGVYPGVDVVFYDNAGQLEYDFVVAPGADARSISIGFDGAERLEVAEGALLVHSANGVLRQSVPVIYQHAGDETKAVAGGFAVTGGRSARFDLGSYDETRELVIDPVLVYSSYVGGTNWDSAYGVTTDKSGFVYVAGVSRSSNFPVRNQIQTHQGAEDIVVLKFDPSQSGDASLVSSTYIGGTRFDVPFNIQVDVNYQVYLAGYTLSPDFPVQGGFQTDPGDLNYDAFLVRLNSSLTTIDYSTYIGGSSDDRAYDISVSPDGSGRVCVTGYSGGSLPLRNEMQIFQGGLDAFITEIDTVSSGLSSLMISTYIGGTGNDWARGVTMDALGNIYVVGQTYSSNFPLTNPMQSGSDSTKGHAFVTKIDPTGTVALYSTFLGGSNYETAYAVTADSLGRAYVVGTTASSDFPTINGYRSTASGSYDGFLTVLDATGAFALYSTYIGGAGDDGLDAVALDDAGNVYAAGWAASANFPTSNATQAYGGSYDAVVARFNTSVSGDGSLLFSTFAGGSGIEHANAMTLDSLGNVYLVGDTNSNDLPVLGAFQDARAGDYDLYLVKISQIANTIGVYTQSNFYLRFAQQGGGADLAFSFGGSSAVPVVGDWNGDGTDTIGIYVPATGTFFLRNSNAGGGADIVFSFGPSSSTMTPVIGDWNSDGVDTIGLYNPATSAFFLRNSNTNGNADVVFGYGPAGQGWLPIAGDWNGDGLDTVGLYNPANGTFYLRNANQPGNADMVFTFGPANATPIAADWNGDGKDSIGVYMPATGAWFLRNQNSAGAADLAFSFGPTGSTPLTGNWDGK